MLDDLKLVFFTIIVIISLYLLGRFIGVLIAKCHNEKELKKMDKFELLNKLFSDKEFLENNKDRTNLDEIYEAVVAVEPTITKEELDEYLVNLSENVEKHLNGELTEEALDDVAGGAVALTFTIVAGVIGGCYAAGLAIGEAVAHYKNRKKKK